MFACMHPIPEIQSRQADNMPTTLLPTGFTFITPLRNVVSNATHSAAGWLVVWLLSPAGMQHAMKWRSVTIVVQAQHLIHLRRQPSE